MPINRYILCKALCNTVNRGQLNYAYLNIVQQANVKRKYLTLQSAAQPAVGVWLIRARAKIHVID